VLRVLIIPLLLVGVARGGVRPSVERVDAIVGHPLVLAVVGDDASDFRRGFETRLDDGRVLDNRVYRLSPGGAIDAGWIGSVTAWSALPAKEAFARPALAPGAWYAVIALPIDAVGQGLWIDGVRHDVNWLPDPERAAFESGGVALWESPVPEMAKDSETLGVALEALVADPFQRWRVRLVRDGIAPAGEPERTGPDGTALDALRDDLGASDAKRFLGELARSHEARWQLIFGRLALIDRETAARMRRRLGGVAMIEGRWVPCWAPDSTDLRALQLDLLSPFVDDRTRELRARAWLDSQPRSVAWVIDDAGQSLEGRRLSPTLGVLSLPPRLSDLLVEAPGPIGGPELITVPARDSIRLVSSVPMVQRRGRSAQARTNTLEVRVGRDAVRVDPIATVVGALPPGVSIGPMHNEWTMSAFLDGSPEAGALPALDRATAGLVRRVAPLGTRDAVSGWSVYLACSGSDLEGDAVTVWTGPFGLPRGVWRVLPDGSVRTLFGPAPERATAVPTANGWAMDLRLPASVIGPDGVLRLGLEREHDGGRTSWPRRVLPWQDEPGRMPIDTRVWSGF